jgi:Mn2+/Fe2+ NRAMP family transporter
LLIVVAVINGMAAAPFLVVVMLIGGSRRFMGDYVNGKLAKCVGWATAGLMAVAAIALIASGGISL